MGRRYRVKGRPRHWVERDKRGRFKEWTRIGRSLPRDRALRAKHVPRKLGRGHLGDYQSGGRKRKPPARRR